MPRESLGSRFPNRRPIEDVLSIVTPRSAAGMYRRVVADEAFRASLRDRDGEPGPFCPICLGIVFAAPEVCTRIIQRNRFPDKRRKPDGKWELSEWRWNFALMAN